MAEIVNLRQARKAKARADKVAGAATNRARHGLSKVERCRVQDEASRLTRTLEGARRETNETD